MIDTLFLTRSPLFQNLDEAERAQILMIGQVRQVKGGEVIFREGDAGDGLFIVLKGSVRISKRSATGEEALAVLEHTRPDLILLDLMMPELDGFEVIKIVKGDAATKHIPVLIMSNLGQEDHIQKGMGLGLAICHSIINNHGGLITVDSTLGVGTTFYIYLPAVESRSSQGQVGKPMRRE